VTVDPSDSGSGFASIDACQRGSWSVVVWPRDRVGGKPSVVPFRCRSARCLRCAASITREDFERIAAGAEKRPDWLFLVLTFDPSRWHDQGEAFARAGWLWTRMLRKRIERKWGKVEYVQTWEATRAGWPHVNVLLRSDALMRDVLRAGLKTTQARKGSLALARTARFPRAFRRWLKRQVVACGFGPIVWCEYVGSAQTLAGYFAKVAGELVRAHKKPGDQRPLLARGRFHRLRSAPVGRNALLPPRRRGGGGEWTGALAKRPADSWGDGPTWADVNHLDAQRAFDAEKRAAFGPGAPVVIRRELLRERASAWRALWAAGASRKPSTGLRARLASS
jgi:hypothetical protein